MAPACYKTPMSLEKRSRRDLRIHRPVTMTTGFHRLAEGSVLYSAGGTVVLCTASVDASVPKFLVGRGKGGRTAEYQMQPRCNPKRRESRDGRRGSIGGRAKEIERLIGRSLRAAIDLDKFGERSITIDCDVLEADGGTRTASVTGGFVAMAIALSKLKVAGSLKSGTLRDQVAAISVGHVDGQYALDLCYAEDSTARVDLNFVGTGREGVVEIQGTAEGEAVPRSDMDALIDLGMEGIVSLCKEQRKALEEAGVDLDDVMS